MNLIPPIIHPTLVNRSSLEISRSPIPTVPPVKTPHLETISMQTVVRGKRELGVITHTSMLIAARHRHGGHVVYYLCFVKRCGPVIVAGHCSSTEETRGHKAATVPQTPPAATPMNNYAKIILHKNSANCPSVFFSHSLPKWHCSFQQ